MDEHDLFHRLHRAADATAADMTPDLAAVERGAARVRGRRRWATGVAAAMLVAGAGGAGFGLGQAAGSGGETAAGQDGDAAPGDTVEPPSTEAPTPAPTLEEPVAPAPEPVPVGSEAPAPPGAGTVGGAVATAVDVAGGVPVPVPHGGYFGSGTALTLEYVREFADGLRVRALTGPGYRTDYAGGDWQPPGWCYPTGELRVTLDGDAVVDVMALGRYAELPPETGIALQRFDAGIADGQPTRVVVVQASGDISSVAVTWDDGATDTATVENGLAVLVVAGDSAFAHTYTVDVTSPNGTESSPGVALESRVEDGWGEACNPPPPALPEPGEQPAHPAAAEQALGDDFAQLWEDLRNDTEGAHLDDWTGVLDALATIREGQYADAAASSQHIIDEVSFTSPTEAWFRYTLDTSAGAFSGRYGTATLGADGWVFPRAVVCQDISLAGAGCEPGVAPIYPPSWYAANGSNTDGSCVAADDGTATCTYCTVDADGGEECTTEPPPVTPPAPIPTIQIEG